MITKSDIDTYIFYKYGCDTKINLKLVKCEPQRVKEE